MVIASIGVPITVVIYFILVLIDRNSLKLSKEDYVLSPRIPKCTLIVKPVQKKKEEEKQKQNKKTMCSFSLKSIILSTLVCYRGIPLPRT